MHHAVDGWFVHLFSISEFEKSTNILSTSDTLTRVKQISDLSRSPCSQQYERMRLGSLNFSASNRGPWKITALNMTYAVCNRYRYRYTYIQ